MIEQSSSKVKRKIKQVLHGISSHLSVPNYKFILEMVSGTLSSGSLNMMELSRSLKETIGIILRQYHRAKGKISPSLKGETVTVL